MVYVNSRGELVQDKPAVSKIVDIFTGFFAVILLFFRTLFEPLIGADTRRTDNYRPDGRGGGRGGRDDRAPRNRRIGGFGDFSSGGPNAPPCASGG